MESDSRIIHGLSEIPPQIRGGALTIGNFDGVHVGHQRIVARAAELAREVAAPAVAMVLEPPPERILWPDQPLERITPHRVRCQLLLEAGADFVLEIPTDRALLDMTSDEFFQRIVLEALGPRHLVEGDDFRFGHDRRGDVRMLSQRGDEHNMAVHVMSPVTLHLAEGPRRVSSTIIRQMIAAGRIEEVNRCLGRHYTLYDKVISGAGHGRVLEFPTANLPVGEQVIPGDGVYAGIASVGDVRCAAAISIGNKPTLGPSPQRNIEAFLLDASGDFYDQDMELSFLRRIRGQQKFNTAAELTRQIAADVRQVRKIVQEEDGPTVH